MVFHKKDKYMGNPACVSNVSTQFVFSFPRGYREKALPKLENEIVPKRGKSPKVIYPIKKRFFIPPTLSYSFFPLLTFSHLLFSPAELLSACHELRCRYGCVMTRNGTFCFCADGFEVGEDGTSCRGKFRLRWRGPSCHGAAPSLPLPSARLPSEE